MPEPLTDEQFAYLTDLARSVSGIVIEPGKRQMVYARLSRRLKDAGLDSFDAYIARLRDGDAKELAEFANRMTTNLTHFFREPGHFRFLSEQILPAFARGAGVTAPLRVWSAGCSTGQEPYSIAMTIDAFGAPFIERPRILCTDLNSRVVRAAEAGCFERDELRGLTEDQIRRWFREVAPRRYAASDQLRSMMLFKQHNLFGEWPIRGGVDAIFCRNVLIYFDSDSQLALLRRFTDLLTEGGHLFLGHSETLTHAGLALKRVATTVYRKVDAG